MPKEILRRRRGALPAEDVDRLDDALRFALGLDCHPARAGEARSMAPRSRRR